MCRSDKDKTRIDLGPRMPRWQNDRRESQIYRTRWTNTIPLHKLLDEMYVQNGLHILV